MFKSLTLGVISLCLSAAALAQNDTSPTSGWTLRPFEIKVDIPVSATEDYILTGWLIEPADTSKPFIRFTCSPRNGLVAALYPRPDRVAEPRGRVKQGVRKGTLKIAGRDDEAVTWTHYKGLDVMQSRKQSIAAKLYNAAATGAAVTVRVPLSQDEVNFASPPADDVLKRFATECGLNKKTPEAAE